MGKSQQSGRGFVNGTHQFRSVLRCFFEQIIRDAFGGRSPLPPTSAVAFSGAPAFRQ
jgi:hypothetical protein